MALKRLSEEDLIDYLASMCEARKQAVADRGAGFLLRLRNERSYVKQLELMARTGDKTLLNRLCQNLCSSGSREVLLLLARREAELTLMPNEWTQRVRRELLDALGMSEAGLATALQVPEEPPEPIPSEPVSGIIETASPDEVVESGMVKRLKGFLWKK